jgi:hypothetical protein
MKFIFRENGQVDAEISEPVSLDFSDLKQLNNIIVRIGEQFYTTHLTDYEIQMSRLPNRGLLMCTFDILIDKDKDVGREKNEKNSYDFCRCTDYGSCHCTSGSASS